MLASPQHLFAPHYQTNHHLHPHSPHSPRLYPILSPLSRNKFAGYKKRQLPSDSEDPHLTLPPRQRHKRLRLTTTPYSGVALRSNFTLLIQGDNATMPCAGECITLSTRPSIPNPTASPYTYTRSDSPTGITRTPSPSTSTSTMPPSPKYTASPSPPTLPQPRLMKRPNNPKRLSLALSINPSDTSPTDTPFTPGPPKTPSLALSMSLGRATIKQARRPSLLALITQPTQDMTHSFEAPQGRHNRVRASTTIDEPSTSFDQGWGKAAPHAMGRGRTYGPGTTRINEMPSLDTSFTSPGSSDLSHSQSHSRSSTSASSSSTPSSSPPLIKGLGLGFRKDEDMDVVGEPYADGPVEIVPLVYLGAEDSLWSERWKMGSGGVGKRVRVLNVAQEIDNPFTRGLGGESQVGVGSHEVGGWEYEYCHLRWSHGEGLLASVPEGGSLEGVITGKQGQIGGDQGLVKWGFWRAIQWLEEARRDGVPVLIHCQCGVSRSATLVIAYLMTLAAAGIMPAHLGHLKGMQDTYDMVKAKSPCIGPNVSLVFQLVEYSRNLTTLLTTHLARPGAIRPDTSFPTVEDAGLSEAEWARKRREFEDDECVGVRDGGMSPEDVEGEARRLDEAMVERRRRRE